MIALLIALVVCLGYYVYTKGRANEDFFARWKIKYSKPEFIFGHSRPMMLRKLDMFEFFKRVYNEFPHEKANAVWDMRTPYVLLRDVDLLKRFVVKEFDHFVDHQSLIDESMDPIMGNSLISLTGDKWREMRAALSPAFTGSKMRQMLQLVIEVTDQLTQHLRKECGNKQGVTVEHELKELCSKYTNDLIAICAFEIQVDTLKDPDNAFYKTGLSVMDRKLVSVVKVMGFRFVPWLMKAFKIKLMSSRCTVSSSRGWCWTR